ncbi:transcriptional regulator with XRE-family HTH domain [Xanthomonas arboricola]|uniref:helix-turn-helix domain-containing protein n=1 Tax=Xanthomonas euroxanthea TaxID=2259622 RepID=UPI00161A43A2|nr:helix-turn-helix transcriptional regulator [Xanthomonas euroxanthea]MBB3814569.1 transcriptional regulator with XRE-family HTH domain [Xanthomonas euroxanthea]
MNLEPLLQNRYFSTIGARMRAAREAAKLSQLDVAAELGVTKGSLSAWQNDKNFPQL